MSVLRRLPFNFALAKFSTCATSVARPVHPDKPLGYISLVDKQVPYDLGLALQSLLVSRRHHITNDGYNDGDPSDVVLFLQHPPTFTAGRRIRGHTENEERRFRELGADYFETMRGGQVTFHGPGQLIAYPIMDIRDYQLNVRCFVSCLEKVVIDCCSQYGVQANTTENTGVWVGQDHKIAALGVHLQRYVSSHGLALNCNVDLGWYKHIVPCGLADKKITSLSEQLGTNFPVNQFNRTARLLNELKQFFERSSFKDQTNCIYPKSVVGYNPDQWGRLQGTCTIKYVGNVNQVDLLHARVYHWLSKPFTASIAAFEDGHASRLLFFLHNYKNEKGSAQGQLQQLESSATTLFASFSLASNANE